MSETIDLDEPPALLFQHACELGMARALCALRMKIVNEAAIDVARTLMPRNVTERMTTLAA